MAILDGTSANDTMALPEVPAPSAACEVAGITEILEQILLDLPPRDLFLAQRVSHKFEAVIERLLTKSPFQLPLNYISSPHVRPLPIVPKLFGVSGTYRTGLPSPGPHDRWNVFINFDERHLKSTSPVGVESWRKLPACRDTTKQIVASLSTGVNRYTRRIPANMPSNAKALPDHSILFTSQKAITLGDVAGWACALQDAVPSDHGCKILFRAVVDGDGADRVVGWQEHEIWLLRQRQT